MAALGVFSQDWRNGSSSGSILLIAQVQAMALNIVAVNPAGPGHVAAAAADQPLVRSFLNYSVGVNIANTGPVAVRQGPGTGDFTILTAISSTHIVISVVGYYSKPVQTVHVHPVPGNPTASGTALLNALAGIGNASATKRYVIKIEPGIYDVGSTMLVMKPFVDIEGSGQQATVIQGVGNNDVDQLTAIVKGAASSELRDLQVKSVGSASQSNSISIVMTDGADTKITGVTLVSGGASGNWGLRSIGARPSLKDVTIEVQGGTNSYGIVSRGESALPEIEQTKISVTGAQNGAGIAGASSSRLEKLRDLQINVSASSSAYGIQIIEGQDASVRLAFSTVDVQAPVSYGVVYYFTASGPLKVEQSQVRANGATSFGLYGLGHTAMIDHSQITGATNTVYGFFVALIGATRLDGGPVSVGSATCAGVYDESFTFIAGPACP